MYVDAWLESDLRDVGRIGDSLDTILTETRDTADRAASRGQDYDTLDQPHAFRACSKAHSSWGAGVLPLQSPRDYVLH